MTTLYRRFIAKLMTLINNIGASARTDDSQQESVLSGPMSIYTNGPLVSLDTRQRMDVIRLAYSNTALLEEDRKYRMVAEALQRGEIVLGPDYDGDYDDDGSLFYDFVIDPGYNIPNPPTMDITMNDTPILEDSNDEMIIPFTGFPDHLEYILWDTSRPLPDKLPSNLRTLVCQMVKQIPIGLLPDTLEELYCDEVEYLPAVLPVSLKVLSAANVKKLPDNIPEGLTTLRVDFAEVPVEKLDNLEIFDRGYGTVLPDHLPPKLVELYAGHVSVLPEVLPHTLRELHIRKIERQAKVVPLFLQTIIYNH